MLYRTEADFRGKMVAALRVRIPPAKATITTGGPKPPATEEEEDLEAPAKPAAAKKSAAARSTAAKKRPAAQSPEDDMDDEVNFLTKARLTNCGGGLNFPTSIHRRLFTWTAPWTPSTSSP